MNRSKSLLTNSIVFSILTAAMCVLGICLLNRSFVLIAFAAFCIMTSSMLLSTHYYNNPNESNKFINGFSYTLLLPVACCIFIIVFILELSKGIYDLIFRKKGGGRNDKSVETMRDRTTGM
ncbi:hypothetical protein SDC9_144512 [bioreactor metagenome]|uniref:Uncharacterized protein n=1 Tax=bioreactor metagenome TaxID=1076179 RepID=A0A645E728_9ZZZZ